MTPRSLMIIVLRIAGILFLTQLMAAIPQGITAVATFFIYNDSNGMWVVQLIGILTVAIYIGVIYALVFKSELIVEKLGMAKGFEEKELQINLDRAWLTRIAIIMTGAIIILAAIPDLCREIMAITVQQSYSILDSEERNWSPVIILAVKILIGLLIIGERQRILAFLLRKPEDDIKQPNK